MIITQLQLLIHPFTKVEESFNLHGIYDYLFQSTWSTWAHQGDHLTFTGPIPRTFLGSIIVGFISSPIISIFKTLGFLNSKYGQHLVRSILAIINSSSIAYFGLCTRYVFGNSIGMMTIILSSLQFHLPFYSSRTLPNMFAFSLGPLLRCGSLLSLAAVIFRLELLALLFPITLFSLISRSVSIWEVLTRGFLVVFAALEVTVPLDSYFWQKFTWPEGSSVFFNVIQGHSSDWGIMPWHEYFTKSLPKLLGLSYPIGLIGFLIDRKTSFLGINCLVFISLMSFLKHKEWRFIVYVIPIFNLSTSVCLTKIGMMCPSIKNLRWYLFTLICLITVSQTVFTSYISYHNYPGGRALKDLHSIPSLANR
ncbi:family 22 glycosyltransferase [Melampsora larici-populina 98AG31]|uniref:Mannosyltransferase n=1 Tax=Melampsora larici-populina (strain 98AG31 / pathotype 3-4-7) TaxID=747676 RepID=F4S9U6_MELLP|nr:family 22 glycosyltransferase [Melampsora larici-populina 98AG31]EGF98578.1 family 22 glycosyltransferase [Melampsora larici-populina 98AG31]